MVVKVATGSEMSVHVFPPSCVTSDRFPPNAKATRARLVTSDSWAGDAMTGGQARRVHVLPPSSDTNRETSLNTPLESGSHNTASHSSVPSTVVTKPRNELAAHADLSDRHVRPRFDVISMSPFGTLDMITPVGKATGDSGE